jgi:hypothetical protein
MALPLCCSTICCVFSIQCLVPLSTYIPSEK